MTGPFGKLDQPCSHGTRGECTKCWREEQDRRGHAELRDRFALALASSNLLTEMVVRQPDRSPDETVGGLYEYADALARESKRRREQDGKPAPVPRVS